MEAYMANLKLTSKENSIERSLQVKFASSLLDLASFIYVSMVKKENQKDYSQCHLLKVMAWWHCRFGWASWRQKRLLFSWHQFIEM